MLPLMWHAKNHQWPVGPSTPDIELMCRMNRSQIRIDGPLVLSRAKAISLGLCLIVSSCAFTDGLPTGEVRASATVAFAPSSGRLDSEGRLITSQDYAIQIDDFTLTYDALLGRMQAGTQATLSAFDPANPPPQYSLCHNGHCHHDDGRLVDYEDIALEIANADGGASSSTVSFYAGESVSVSADSQPIPLTLCSTTGCPVDTGRLLSVELVLSRAEIRGRVFDRRTGDSARLPLEGLPLQLDISGSTVFARAVTAAFNEDTTVGVELHAHHDISEKIFDQVDFQNAIDGAQLTSPATENIFNRMREEDTLNISVTRYNRD